MQNKNRLTDVLTRHQIYLEGVKVYEQYKLNNVLADLSKELRFLFSDLRYASFDEMTKAQYTLFLKEVKKTQSRIFSAYLTELIKQLQLFMVIDRKVTKAIFATVVLEENEPEPEPEDGGEPSSFIVETEKESDKVLAAWGIGSALFGLLAIAATAEGASKLWSVIVGQPIPANGLKLQSFLQGFANSAQQSIENIIQKGYANKTPIRDVLNEIIGTAEAQRRDGQLNRVFNQGGAVLDTIIQHISAMAQAAVGSAYYGRYMWVSVIDSRTTDICRDRDRNIYVYGEGPLPPAHIRCRSKIVPIEDGGKPGSGYDSFYDFASKQPISVQNDILTRQQAEGIRNGTLKEGDLPKFDNAPPLSPEEFAAKLAKILKR